MRMSMPAAGSRPASTSQNTSLVFTPVPSGAGHAMSGSTFVSAAAGALRAGADLRVCDDKPGAATIAITAIRKTTRGMNKLYQLLTQVRLEEVVHPMPRVTQYVLAREVVELTRIRHERDQVALSFLEQLVHEPHRVQVRHVDVRRPVQYEQRPLQSVDVRDRRRFRVDSRILLRGTDAACCPAAVIRVVVIHLVVNDAGDVHARAEQLRLIRDGDQREEPAITQAPHA